MVSLSRILRKTVVAADPPPAEWLESSLPSEAQWEYAAHGPEERRSPWDDKEAAESPRVARHVAGAAYTVETLPAAEVSERLGMSSFGLHHMAGNVWQWCRDWYRADFYRRPEAVAPDAQNAEATGVRSERGGSWVGPAELARPTYRARTAASVLRPLSGVPLRRTDDQSILSCVSATIFASTHPLRRSSSPPCRRSYFFSRSQAAKNVFHLGFVHSLALAYLFQFPEMSLDLRRRECPALSEGRAAVDGWRLLPRPSVPTIS